MELVDNFGILAPITWNSNDWTQPLTAADLQHAHFGYVKENQDAAENLNFGHRQYPAEAGGTFIGYSPKLSGSVRTGPLGAVFFLSTDYRHHRRCIVGVYGFPQLGDFTRKAKHKLFKHYTWGNVRAQVSDIVYFANPVVLTDELAARHDLLPVGKALSKRGFNYLTSANVVNVLRLAVAFNGRDTQLAALLHRLETDPAVEADVPQGLTGLSGLGPAPEADTLAGLAELEKRMHKLRPEVKRRVVAVIERGSIAASVKRRTGYKCLLCEALGLPPLGFRKSNGVPYVETHHVDPVAN